MEKVISPRGMGRSYKACEYAIEHNCDIIAPDRSGVIALMYAIENICKGSDMLELYRITYHSDVDSATVIKHNDADVTAVEIRLYDVCQYFEREKTERGRRNDVVFDDIDRCMQVLCSYRNIGMVTMEVE